MLAISARVSPCRARCWRWSVGRETVNCRSATATRMSGCTWRDSVPLGPLTSTVRPLTVTSTSLGSTTGKRPIRDIPYTPAGLPNIADDLAAHTQAPRVFVRHDPPRCREDRDAQPATYLGHFGPLPVDPQARAGSPGGSPPESPFPSARF